MARIILKCPYLKPGGTLDRGGLVRYIATREGVEFYGAHMHLPQNSRTKPATEKQRKLVAQLLAAFPDTQDLFEYEDYTRAPTRENASAFITVALEHNLAEAAGRSRFVSYIAERPGVQRVSGHGLFGAGDGPVDLEQVAAGVSAHPGNVWAPILSLRREDAARLGYDNAAGWRALLQKHADVFARNMKIDPANFVWYAAYHDEGHHPHVHMLCYAKEPRAEYLTVDGIRGIKSQLARDIFRQDLVSIYKRQTLHRDEAGQAARQALREYTEQLAGGTLHSAAVTDKMEQLAKRLQFHGGRMAYGYLRPPVKALVREIVDELEKDPRVARAYDAWRAARREVTATYTKKAEPQLPLSQNDTFKPVRNMVVEEAVRLMRGELIIEQTPAAGEPPMPPEASAAAPPPHSEAEDSGPPPHGRAGGAEDTPGNGPRVEWSERYRAALRCLYGDKETEPDHPAAHQLLLDEAETGNALAMHDLGRLYKDGLGVEPDPERAGAWYARALETFHIVKDRKAGRYVEYRIGKMYAAGLGTPQDYAEAARWHDRSAAQGYKYAEYSLGCLYRDVRGVEQDHAEAFRLFSASARQEFPYAAFECGKMLRDGTGTPPNADAAGRAFRNAYEGFLKLVDARPDDKLLYRIGWMLLTGTGTEADTKEAAVYFERAAKLGNPHAQYQLAKLILAEDSTDPIRLRQAMAWMHKAAGAGAEAAQYALGKLYLEDERVRDLSAALYWFGQAAAPGDGDDKGNSFAQYRLGKLLLAGTELPKDAPAALAWLELAAGQGNEYAQYALGMAYAQDPECGIDPARALYRLGQAAQQGFCAAAYQLGKIHAAGEIVEKDEDAAVHWFGQAAREGNQFAQYALGKLLLFGGGEIRDRDAARHWLTEAAAQGNPYAAHLLQHMEEWERGDVLMAGTRLLSGLGKVFENNMPPARNSAVGFEIDRKRRSELRRNHHGRGILLAEQDGEQAPAKTHSL